VLTWYYSAKREKRTELGGLLSGWRKQVRKPNKQVIQAGNSIPKSDEQVKGEFDEEESPQLLATIRASKSSTVRIREDKVQPVSDSPKLCYMLLLSPTQTILPVVQQSVTKASGGRRTAKVKYGVADLPLPAGSLYTNRWRKQFRPSIIGWAATMVDPFGTNSLLADDIVREIWEKIFPEVDIGVKEERNLEIITAVVSTYHFRCSFSCLSQTLSIL